MVKKFALPKIFIPVFLLIFVSIFTSNAKAAVPSNVTKHSPAAFSGSINLGESTDHIYQFTNDVIIDNQGDITGANTGVVFIQGNLNIGPLPGKTLKHGNKKSGLVFVVKGNVNIHQSVEEIDAVIIAEGIICTAYDGTACLDGNTQTPQLTINGSLISLNQNNPAEPIRFRRNLGADNVATPAEKIVYQPKYLVILRDMLSDTFQKWSEVAPSDTSTPPALNLPPPPSSAHCADGTDDQTNYINGTMVGCNGNVTFDNALSLCASGSDVCSAAKYSARGGNTIPPNNLNPARWLSSKIGGGGQSCQSTNLCGSSSCWVYETGNSLGLRTNNSLNGYDKLCPNLDQDDIGFFIWSNLTDQRGAMCCSQ